MTARSPGQLAEGPHILVTGFAPKKDIHMFPYKARTTKLLGGLLKLLYGRGKRD